MNFFFISYKKVIKSVILFHVKISENILDLMLYTPYFIGIERNAIMAMDAKTIKTLIKDGIPEASVRIEDLRGDGDHYAAYIESPSFEGLSRIQQHQMVYQALQGKMGEELHALAIQTSVPETK